MVVQHENDDSFGFNDDHPCLDAAQILSIYQFFEKCQTRYDNYPSNAGGCHARGRKSCALKGAIAYAVFGTLVARLLDAAFVIPGTNRTFGIDAVIGLIPGIGDIVTTLLSNYIIWEARNLGLPRHQIARMYANLAVHAIVGSIPLIGDAFDAMFKVNQRNMRIIHRHLTRSQGKYTTPLR